MKEKDDIKKLIKEVLNEFEFIDEERITNTEAHEYVNRRENFIGSHIFGEDIGEVVEKPGLMYVAYSYGEQHPLYVWVKDPKGTMKKNKATGELEPKGSWYYNRDDYTLDDGTPNVWTQKHLKLLRPNEEVQGRPTSYLIKMINDFKKNHNIIDISHTSLEPGEK